MRCVPFATGRTVRSARSGRDAGVASIANELCTIGAANAGPASPETACDGGAVLSNLEPLPREIFAADQRERKRPDASSLLCLGIDL